MGLTVSRTYGHYFGMKTILHFRTVEDTPQNRSLGRWPRQHAVRFVSLIICFLLIGCTQASVSTQPAVNISIAGSTAFFPVLFDLTEAFSERHPNVVFDVRGGGSGFGESQLTQGKIDLAATSYLIEADDSPATLDAAQPISQTVDPNSTEEPVVRHVLEQSVQIPIGLDAIAIIVNQSNAIGGITLTDLRDIYGGRILDWSQLGSEAGEIQLVIREDHSGIQELFELRVMRDKQISLTAVIMPTNADVLSYVALYPNAIGYISRGYVMAEESDEDVVPPDNRPEGIVADTEDEPTPFNETAGNVSLLEQLSSHSAYLESLATERSQVKVIALDDHIPTHDQILNQQYYLVYPLYLTALDEPSGWLSLFIDFILSPSGQEIVSRYHAPVR